VANQTQAHAAVMEQVARKFERANEELEAMLGRLMSELDVLRTAWQGAGGRSFEEVKRVWAGDQRALHRALGETAAAIRSAGGTYRSSDAAAQERVAASHRTIELPL
jgi:ESAT-6 family protein